MSGKVYRKRFGSFQYVGVKSIPLLGGPEIYWQGQDVAVMLELDTGVIHKHGGLDEVNAYFARMWDKFKSVKSDSLMDGVVVVSSGDWDVDELNKALANGGGYILKVLEKMDGLVTVQTSTGPPSLRS